MLPKEIIWLAASVFSWALFLMPVTAILGHWTASGWIGLIGLMTAPVIAFSIMQAQVERRQDPVARRIHFRTYGH